MKYLIIILIILSTYSCRSVYTKNFITYTQWTDSASFPIIRDQIYDIEGEVSYLLIDKEGDSLSTGVMDVWLPKVIYQQ